MRMPVCHGGEKIKLDNVENDLGGRNNGKALRCDWNGWQMDGAMSSTWSDSKWVTTRLQAKEKMYQHGKHTCTTWARWIRVKAENKYVQNGMPIPEPDVRTTGVADIVHIEKEPKLRLSRESSTLWFGVCQQTIVRCQHQPMLWNVHRHGPIQSTMSTFLHPNRRAKETNLDPFFARHPTRWELHLGLPACAPKREILLVGDRPPFNAHPAHLYLSRQALIVPPKLMAVNTMGHLRFEIVAFTASMPQRDRVRSDSNSWCAWHMGARVPCCYECRPARWMSMYSNIWRARPHIRTDPRHWQKWE